MQTAELIIMASLRVGFILLMVFLAQVVLGGAKWSSIPSAVWVLGVLGSLEFPRVYLGGEQTHRG